MKLETLVDTEYADALKEAIGMRRDSTIDPATDRQLGLFAYNIARWAVMDKGAEKKLPVELATDPDFLGWVVVSVVAYLDRVDMGMGSKQILVYLKKVAGSAARDLLAKSQAKKRQHEDVQIEGIIFEANFYGNSTGKVAYSIELERSSE